MECSFPIFFRNRITKKDSPQCSKHDVRKKSVINFQPQGEAKMNRFIEGIVHTITPMHVAEFGKDKEVKVMNAQTSSGRVRFPYFPANDVRGRTRRKAGETIMDKVKPVSLPLFHVLSCGSPGQIPATGSESVTRIINGQKDMYLGLFGGGPYIQKGGVRVRDMVPVNQATIEIGMVPECYSNLLSCYERKDKEGNTINQDAAPWVIQEFTHIKVDDLVAANRMRAPELIENYAQVALDYMKSVMENSAVRKDEKKLAAENLEKKRAGEIVASINPDNKTTKVGLGNILPSEAIIPGVPLYFRVDFEDYISDAQVHFFADSLAGIFNEPLGGRGSIGWGIVKADLDLVNGNRTKLFTFDEGMYAVNPVLPGHDECEEALEAYTIKSLSAILLAEPANDSKVKTKATAKG